MRSSLVARRSSLVARRSSLVALILILGSAREARGDLQTNSQVAVTQSDVAGTKFTVWSLSKIGDLLARREDPTGDNRWTNYFRPAGALGPCKPQGVAATSFVNAGHVIERVYCTTTFNLGGSIFELSFDNGVQQGGWRNLNIPNYIGNKAEIAATSLVFNGHWTVFLYFTAAPDDLYVWWEDTAVPGATFLAKIGDAFPYSTTGQLATSRAPGTAPAYLHLFVPRTNGSVDVWRRDAATFENWNIARPNDANGNPINMIGTAAAAEDQITGAPSPQYRALLFATSRVQSNILFVATATSSAAQAAFSWTQRPLAFGQGNFQNSGYAIAATARSNGTNRAIDAVALATPTAYAPPRIFRLRHDSTGLTGLLDIGLDGETLTRAGGLAAYPRANRSAIAFLGGGASGDPYRLYLKDGTDSTASDAWNWANHGDGEPTSALPAAPIGETSAAFFRGRAIVAGINHPGSGGPTDFSQVRTSWSSTDGDTWQNWVQPPSGYNLTTDPTVDFDESGTAYLCLEAINAGPECTHSPGLDPDLSGFAILLYTTSNGAYGGDPVRVDPVEAPEHGLDHPFMAIYRDLTGNQDRIHVAWKDGSTGEVLYNSKLVGGVFDAFPHALLQGAGATAPYLSVGAQGAVYVYWGRRICRINSTFSGCADTPQELEPNLRSDVSLMPLNNGTADEFNPGTSAVVASPTNPDVVYYAFERYEDNEEEPGDPDQADLYFSTGLYSPNQTPPSMPFDFSPPILVGDFVDDDADQFGSSIAVSQRAGVASPLVSVMWHDRHAGNCDGFDNRCFRSKRATLATNGLTFLYPQTIPIDPGNSWSDPAELPVTCLGTLNEDEHFLGHYRTVRGDLLHVRHIIVGSPNGGADPEAVLGSGWISGGFYYW